METKKGTIEKIDVSEGISKAGNPYTRFVYTVDGNKYSSFSKFDIKLGDKVEMTGVQSGKFWNLEGMRLDDGTTQTPIESPKETEGSTSTFNTAQALVKLSQQLEELTAVVTQIRGLLSNEKGDTDKKED